VDATRPTGARLDALVAAIVARLVEAPDGEIDRAIVDAQRALVPLLDADRCALWTTSPSEPSALRLRHILAIGDVRSPATGTLASDI
jgi:hypothetical protein